MTVLDAIQRAMRLINAINVGEAPTAPEQQAGLLALNSLVDSWGTQRLTMWSTSRVVQNITAGVQQYALGPAVTGTDWVMARPTYIDEAGLIIPATPATYERPLHIVRSDDEWARIRIKGLPSSLATTLYYQPDFPTGTVLLWPAPTVSQQVALYVPTAVSQFTSINQVISLPPGYSRALAYNLAVEMAPEFDREPSDVVIAIAAFAMADLKRANLTGSIGKRRVDPAAAGLRRGGSWDYTIGEER